MRFNESFLNELKSRITLSRIIGTKVNFDNKKSRPAKGDYWACCPFHLEKTPSFRCEDTKGRYHCFGCKESGDAISFLMKLEGVSFNDAVERLAKEAGLELPKQEFDQQIYNEKKNIYNALEQTCKYFEKCLDENIEAYDYLKSRNLSNKTIKTFRLGYASSNRNNLQSYLKNQKIDQLHLLKAGILVKSDQDNSLYPRFVDRVIFPITDLKGRVVGFGGRSLKKDNKAKYINTAETELFHKSKIVYNLKNAREFCYKNRSSGAYNESSSNFYSEIVVVEGYMDVISLSQAGFQNTVAPLGTALTEDQMQLIWQSSHYPILCFDGDNAGLQAAYRAIDRMIPLLNMKNSLRFVLLPNGTDPDDIIKKEGAAGFKKHLSSTVNLIDLLWQREIFDKDFTKPEVCAQTETSLLQIISKIKDNSLRNHYARIIKDKLWNLFHHNKQNNKKIKEFPLLQKLEKKVKNVFELREKSLMSLLWQNPFLCFSNYDKLSQLELQTPIYNSCLKNMLDIVNDNCNVKTIEEVQDILVQKLDENLIKELKRSEKLLNFNKTEDSKILDQTLYLYNKAHVVKKLIAEQQAQEDMNEESFYNLLFEVNKTLSQIEKNLIEEL